MLLGLIGVAGSSFCSLMSSIFKDNNLPTSYEFAIEFTASDNRVGVVESSTFNVGLLGFATMFFFSFIVGLILLGNLIGRARTGPPAPIIPFGFC